MVSVNQKTVMRLWTRIELILENGISKSKDGDETVDKDRIDTGEQY